MEAPTITLPAPAKINLFLHILNQREDGYHNIQTVFQFLDFFDALTFVRREDKQITLTPEFTDIPFEQNLIIKAARLLQSESKTPYGVDIQLKKRLPVGGGVGGGSSNAATTLHALNALWEINHSVQDLTNLGVSLGADVPVFLHGHAAWAEGIGDQLTPIILPEPWCLLIIPPCKINTMNLYNDSRLTRDSAALRIADYQYNQGHNDFEPIVRFDYPEVSHALDWLKSFGKSRMTGSGGCVFALFDTEEEASRIAAQVPSPYQCKVAKVQNLSPLNKETFAL
jgi:4-diphosphocytidyl-2-C-methyl-D-erythritol kinase